LGLARSIVRQLFVCIGDITLAGRALFQLGQVRRSPRAIRVRRRVIATATIFLEGSELVHGVHELAAEPLLVRGEGLQLERDG
jgi:hypothetical protein